LGQGVTYYQAGLIVAKLARTPNAAVIVLGDSDQSPDKDKESKVSRRSAELIRGVGFMGKIYVPELPYGDPGDWNTRELFQFINDTKSESELK
jgi:hypothetical protein